MLVPAEAVTVQFAHRSYRLAERFARRAGGIRHFQTWDAESTRDRLGEADVLVASSLWRDTLLDAAPRLRFIQTCSAGYDNFGLDALRARGVRLANATGTNVNAVSEHALGMMLSLTRLLHEARDRQPRHEWRGVISDPDAREDELPGKIVLIYGAGAIGARIARLLRAFDATPIGIKRDVLRHDPAFEEVHPPEDLHALLPDADFVVLCCPLNDETRGVLDAEAFARMKRGAFVVNVARGACVDEAALVEALGAQAIAGAGIDVTCEEPLPAGSPLWDFPNVVLTPHSAGETRRYEDNVAALLLENLERLWRGERTLRNQIV